MAKQISPKSVLLTAFLILLLSIVLGSFYTINSGERGVLLTFGKASKESVSDGLHFKIPFVQDVEKISIRTYKIEESIPAYTKDIQSADIRYTLNFDVVPDNVPALYIEVGHRFQERIITPVVYGVVKDVIGTFNASEIVENRDNVRGQVEERLRAQLSKVYFTNISFQIVNIDYDDTFEQAIVAKQVAEQDALKAKNKTVQVEEEARQKIIAANAEAEAMRVKAEALAKNQKLVELEAIQKWDGKLPEYMLGSSVPFINLK